MLDLLKSIPHFDTKTAQTLLLIAAYAYSNMHLVLRRTLLE